MASWPDIQNPEEMKERPTKGQVRSDFENGYVQSRPRWTRTRRVFQLQWRSMSSSDKETLAAFFEDNLGGTFTWTHPSDGTSYTVRFADDQLEFKHVPVNRWSIKLELEEQ